MNDDDLVRTTTRLLVARGHLTIAALLDDAALHVLPGSEAWSIGGRQVMAESFALVLPAEAFVAFERIAEASGAVVDALRSVVQGPSVALKDLFVLVALSPALDAWSMGYRHAPRVEVAPSVESVLATAIAYLRAREMERAATILGRATLGRAAIPSASAPQLYRYVLALDPEDLAEHDRDVDLRSASIEAIELAARRATERAASVELALRPVLR